MHGVDPTDSFEAFLPQLQIEETECEEDMPLKNYEIVVVNGFNLIVASCFNEIDLLMSLEGLHKLRLVPSLPVGMNLRIDTICIAWMILNLGELFD